jgi:hypothetical protein
MGVAMGAMGAMVKALSFKIAISWSLVVNCYNILSKAVPDSTHQIFVSIQKL